MAVKDGLGPRPVSQTAKRHFLNRLETSSKPWLFLRFYTANCHPARVLLEPAFVLHKLFAPSGILLLVRPPLTRSPCWRQGSADMNLYTRSFCKRLGWDIYQCTHLASPGEQEWMSSFQTFYSRPSWEMQRGADSLHLWVCLNINIRCTSVYPIPGIYHHFPICSPLKFIKVAFFSGQKPTVLDPKTWPSRRWSGQLSGQARRGRLDDYPLVIIHGWLAIETAGWKIWVKIIFCCHVS